jgi:threonine aldolase
MREAIASARVGDDQLGDDPTTRRLEERVAEILGKERALFFPSGIMANQTALAVLARPGTEVLLEAGAHIFNFEDAAAAALSGLQLRPVAAQEGLLTPEMIERTVRPRSRYLPVSSVVCVENTHLASGGRVMPLEVARGIRDLADARDLRVHLDGARLWNACAESGISPADYASTADTVMVALSKGLGAPVGSMLAGDAVAMESAWRVRRRLGGAMRQSGILAAAGLFALSKHLGRLTEDHENARDLAKGIEGIPGLRTVPPETNVVLIDVTAPGVGPEQVLGFLEMRRILMLRFAPGRLRAVTHLDVNRQGIMRTLEALAEGMAQLSGG